MKIDESYGAGNKAINDGQLREEHKCVDHVEAIYGGAKDADVYSDIILEISNGTYDNVYGGNNHSGNIHGSITVNIKETGCKPIIIGGLYGGGYLADYSIYGYKDNGKVRTKAEYEELSAVEKAKITVQKDPRINIISATRIDSIYGGGFQAKVIGNTYVNVNMEKGTLAAEYMKADYLSEQTDATTSIKWKCEGYGDWVEFEDGTKKQNGILPIGTIGEIYGGGSLAEVQGNTLVEIGTGKWITSWDANGNPIWESGGTDGKNYTYKLKTAVNYTQAESDSNNATLIEA
jgi:hypothetical protein